MQLKSWSKHVLIRSIFLRGLLSISRRTLLEWLEWQRHTLVTHPWALLTWWVHLEVVVISKIQISAPKIHWINLVKPLYHQVEFLVEISRVATLVDYLIINNNSWLLVQMVSSNEPSLFNQMFKLEEWKDLTLNLLAPITVVLLNQLLVRMEPELF